MHCKEYFSANSVLFNYFDAYNTSYIVSLYLIKDRLYTNLVNILHYIRYYLSLGNILIKSTNTMLMPQACNFIKKETVWLELLNP